MTLTEDLRADLDHLAERWNFSEAVREELEEQFLNDRRNGYSPARTLNDMQDIADEKTAAVDSGTDSEEQQNDRSNRLEQCEKRLYKDIASTASRTSLDLVKPYADKLQITIPPSLGALLDAWAAAEGRDKTSVTVAALEVGLRQLLKDGSLPPMAVEFYKQACEKQMAFTFAKQEAKTVMWTLDELPI
jgi:hypothetical protein